VLRLAKPLSENTQRKLKSPSDDDVPEHMPDEQLQWTPAVDSVIALQE